MSTSLSNAEMRVLQHKGWRFIQVDDSQWMWVHYDEDGMVDATQKEGLFALDIALAKRECLGLSR